MREDSSDHAVVRVCCLPPFDENVRVLVLGHFGERQPDTGCSPCVEGAAHGIAGHIIADLGRESAECIGQVPTVPGAKGVEGDRPHEIR